MDEISRFAYDLTYKTTIDGKEHITTLRDKRILMFDLSEQKIKKQNGVEVSTFIITIQREYIKRLQNESTLAYDEDLSKILVNIGSLVVQDLIRFLTTFSEKKILTFSIFCDIKTYKTYKTASVISKIKKEIIKNKDKLTEFGIRIYGEGVPFGKDDDEISYQKYINTNDIVFISEGSDRVKRFISKKDSMNKLNTKINKYILVDHNDELSNN